MNINLNLDYSTLFSSLSTNRSSSASSSSSLYGIDLGNYASIRNGSYYQLTKAYYAKNSADSDSSSGSTSSTTSSATVQSDADDLKESADKLFVTGSKSLFNKKEITTKNEDGTTTTKNDYDKDAIYKAVKAFADDYNSAVTSGGKSSNTNVLRQTLNMTKNTSAYKNLLSQVGITIGSDNKLSVDEDTFKKSDMTTVKSIFNGTNSLAYTTSLKASQISYYADKSSGLYDINGSLNNISSIGSSYNSYF
ncbi:MAG: hypothetical protein PHE02_04935 [Lachnospiraceae bacterium]|nr:hypothetical protein [Lachnospiraceae bacterium]